MFTFSVELIKQLRELTGSPLNECKKALQEANSDVNKAAEILRKKGLSSASKH